jgi:hypothetical protein
LFYKCPDLRVDLWLGTSPSTDTFIEIEHALVRILFEKVRRDEFVVIRRALYATTGKAYDFTAIHGDGT